MAIESAIFRQKSLTNFLTLTHLGLTIPDIFCNPGIPGLTFFKSRDPGISGLGKEYPLVLNPRGFNVII